MEPSCYKVEMEKERQKERKVWMDVSPGQVTARLATDDLQLNPKKRPELQRSTSEILIFPSSYGGYDVKRTRSKYIIKDTVSADPSTGTLAPRSLFQQDVQGVEPNVGAALPLTKARNLSSSRSSINIHISGVDHVHPPECSASNPDVRPSRTLNSEDLQLYNQTQSILKKFMKAKDFQEIEQQFISLYPNYWKQSLKKCNVYMNAEIAAADQKVHIDAVGICTRTLQDEMEKERRSSIRNIGLTGNDITDDFRISIMYLNRKYMFAYMARKHGKDKNKRE